MRAGARSEPAFKFGGGQVQQSEGWKGKKEGKRRRGVGWGEGRERREEEYAGSKNTLLSAARPIRGHV